MKKDGTRCDLEDRLLDYGASIIFFTKSLTANYAERHISNQLLRSATAPLAHHGEVQAAESPADFVHKRSIAIKELRESFRWLRLIERAKLLPDHESVKRLINETDQLIRIFVTSIRTAKNRRT
jgi:four helix bundle protein